MLRESPVRCAPSRAWAVFPSQLVDHLSELTAARPPLALSQVEVEEEFGPLVLHRHDAARYGKGGAVFFQWEESDSAAAAETDNCASELES